MKNKLWFFGSAQGLVATLNFMYNLDFQFEDLFEISEDVRYVQLQNDIIHPKTGEVLETKF